MEMDNTSGQGAASVVPDEIKGWNWGAFFLSWIWSIGNKVWIGLLSLVPYAGLIMAIFLGIKGSEWAWRNRRFESIEQFKAVQRKWAYWGLAIVIVSFVIGVILGVTLAMRGVRTGMHPHY